MDERMRRQWAAIEAYSYGLGGIGVVAQATGLSPTTIRKGVAEVTSRAAHPEAPVSLRIRQKGGGRKSKTVNDPNWSKSWHGWLNLSRAVTRNRRCAG